MPCTLTVHHPLLRRSGDIQSSLLQGREQHAPEYRRQLKAVKEALAFQFAPFVTPRIHPATGYDDMHMRVVVEPPGMGV